MPPKGERLIRIRERLLARCKLDGVYVAEAEALLERAKHPPGEQQELPL
jgi:hypothetical protein